MVGESTDTTREISSSEVVSALGSISDSEWEAANWPVIAFVPRETYFRFDEDANIDNRQAFWREVFDPKNFLNPNNGEQYNPEKHMLFVVHSFLDNKRQETMFKAITTSQKSLVEDPGHLINYKYHGEPCEIRSKQIYPTCNFWNFYDNLPSSLQDSFPIPSKEWRNNFVSSRYLKNSSDNSMY